MTYLLVSWGKLYSYSSAQINWVMTNLWPEIYMYLVTQGSKSNKKADIYDPGEAFVLFHDISYPQ